MDAFHPQPSRLGRYARRAGIGLAALLALLVILVAGALASLRIAAVRGFVVTRVNSALGELFKGRLVVHRVGDLGLTGIADADAEIFDPAGHRVADIHGLAVRLSVPTLVWAALTDSSRPLTIRMTSVSLHHAELVLIDNGTGAPTLADTFLPKTPSPPSSGPGTIVIIEQAVFDHVWAHGLLGTGPAIDVELKRSRAKLRTDDIKTSVQLQRTDLRARGLPAGADPIGELQASLDIPSAADKPLGAKAHYRGSAAEVPLVLDASYVDSKLSAVLQAANIPPAAVAKQIPGLELRSPATLSASAAGTLPDLHGTFLLGLGHGTVEGDFELSLRSDLTAKTRVHTRDLDLAELTRSAPASSLNWALQASLRAPAVGPVAGNFELSSPPALIQAQRVPAFSVSGTFVSDSKATRQRVEAHAEIAEPGAATTLDASLTHAQQTTIEFRSTTRLLDPPRLNELARVNRLQGELDAQGTYQIETQVLHAQLQAKTRDVRQGSNAVARAMLTGSIAGVLPHPSADIHLDISDANLAGQHVARAVVAARGPLTRFAVSGELTTQAPERYVQLSTFVSNERGLFVDHPSLNVRQGDTNLRLSARGVQVVAGRTRVDGLRLEGAGSADVSLVYDTSLESLYAQTYDLDLARLSRLFDAHSQLKSGTATVSASYERHAGAARVHFTARSQDLAFDRVSGGSLTADLSLDQGRLDGSAYADLKQLGHMTFDFQELRGIDVLNPEPARITGKLALEGQVRLKDLLQLVPEDVQFPVARALGVVKYELTVEREQVSAGLPGFHLHLSSQHLQLAGRRVSKTTLTTKEEARAAAPLAIKGIDADLDLVHRETGETELSAGLTDAQGKLLALSVAAKTTPRLATLVDELSQNWRRLPLRVRVSVPRRQLEKLPVELRPAGLNGVLWADLAYDGTFAAPDLKLSGSVEKIRQVDSKAAALDVTWQGAYSGTRGTFKASARAGAREVAKADLDFETALNAWLTRADGATPPLEASAHLNFDTFPIGVFPEARTSQLDGTLSGRVALEHFGSDATVDLNLDANSLKLANTDLGRIHSELVAQNGKADARVEVLGQRGTTTAELHSGLDWGARFVPAVRMPADAQLRAKELRLAAFSPLLTSLFGEIDGRLNGELNAHFRGGAPELNGRVDLKDGTVQVASLGQRFDQITARLSLEPGRAKLDELTARATTGKLRVTGEARFTGLDLTGADAHLRIAKNEKVSMSLAGTELGETWGAIDLKIRPGETQGAQALAVEIPELHVRLPDTGSQNLQDLEPAKGVRVGTWQRGQFVTLPLQPLKEGDSSKNENPLVVELHLGDQIFIQQGDATRVQLTGRMRLVLGDPLTMTGQINLKGGKLDVSGKQFEVESGFVTFSGEPDNPTIVATARWDAPDEEHHRVFAEASGTASDIKVNLRAEPPLTKDQVLSLIVTGSAEGSLGGNSQAGGGSTAATAVGAVGGAATQGLNKALSSISDLDVSTRIDTSTGSARPELVIQLSPRVSAQITRALGNPAPGQPPDLTFLTLNFRLLRSWSLSALVGDRGQSGLDLVWRKRY